MNLTHNPDPVLPWWLAPIILAAIAAGICLAFDVGSVLVVVLVTAGALAYFAPIIIANRRSHPQLTAVIALNLFGGWTVIGWIGALVWALWEYPETTRRQA